MTRLPVTLLPPKGSGMRKQTGILWISGETVHLEYRPRFSLPGKPVELFEVGFEGIRKATHNKGFLQDEIVLVLTDLAALEALPAAHHDEHEIVLGVKKEERDAAISLVRQIQLDRMGDIFEEMLEITDIDPDPLL